jgi:Ca2+-binding EF-hand superfamily protein
VGATTSAKGHWVKPTEEELFQMISEVDDNMSGSIDFAEFLKVLLCRAFTTFSNEALRRCSHLLHCCC